MMWESFGKSNVLLSYGRRQLKTAVTGSLVFLSKSPYIYYRKNEKLTWDLYQLQLINMSKSI